MHTKDGHYYFWTVTIMRVVPTYFVFAIMLSMLLYPGGNIQELKKALQPYSKSPIYLTIDLDWFDPSLLAGTGTPEPGGFFWNDFEEILTTLKDFRIVASDIVELSPEIDKSGVSSIVAAKVLRSLILSLENMQ